MKSGGFMISRKTLALTFMITALFLLLANCAGAVPVEEWNRTFGGEYWDEAYSFAQTPDEGYIIAGLTYFNESSDYEDAWLIKADSRGQMLWNRTYAGKRIRKISTTQDGGYLLMGSNNWDFWLMKTDANGQEQWNRTLNKKWNSTPSEKNNIFFNGIEETSDGGSIIAAVEYIELPNNPLTWNSRLIKVDASGNEQWNMTSKRMQDFLLNSVQQTSDGGYILSGTTIPTDIYYMLAGIIDYQNCDAVIIKTDASGNQQWEKTFGWWGEREMAGSDHCVTILIIDYTCKHIVNICGNRLSKL